MKKRKILFLIPNLMYGGAERVLVNLVNNMDVNKYEITVQTLFDVGLYKKELLPHIKYRTFMHKEFRGNSYLFKTFSSTFWWKRIIKQHYDIAVSYLEGPTSRILSGCDDPTTKLVSWLHIELNTSKLAAQGFRNIIEAKRAYERFNRIIAVSQNVKECFINCLHIENSIEVLYNTNETEKIRERAISSIEDNRFITGDVPVAVSVAKLMKTKGFDRLLDVHKRLLDEGLKHRIYILGIGEEKNNLEEKIKKFNCNKSFILLGFKENPYSYVAKSDLYVCSSRREGFSTAVTEALIVGTPVISTNCSGAKELLGANNEYGLVVENSTEGIYKGMKMMLENPEMRLCYKKKAKIRGEFFSKERTVKAVEKMLDLL